MRCLSRKAFNEIGGYDTDLIGLEDLALQARLIEGDFKIGWINDTILHHEEEVGFRQYLIKRRLYGSTDKLFSCKYPEYWKRLQSPLQRSKLLLKHYVGKGQISDMQYIPAIMFIRGAEFIARKH